jgi:hypothetical protein
VKKPVINVDDLEDAGDEALSPATDLAASAFAVRNTANALVTESASIRGTFIRFHEQITTSLDRMTEVLAKEQAAVQRDQFASFKLLEQIVEALERSSPWQAGVVPTEGPVVGNAEAGPSAAAVDTETIALDEVGLIRWAWTPLFLLSDENTEPSDESYVDEAKGSGSEESSDDKNVAEDETEEEADEMEGLRASGGIPEVSTLLFPCFFLLACHALALTDTEQTRQNPPLLSTTIRTNHLLYFDEPVQELRSSYEPPRLTNPHPPDLISSSPWRPRSDERARPHPIHRNNAP